MADLHSHSIDIGKTLYSESCIAGHVLQYTQLATMLMEAGQFGEAEALLNQLLLHVESVKVRQVS